MKPSSDWVWHYTNWDGLNGILKEKELWASQISCLNDTNEVRHAAKLFKATLERHFRNHIGKEVQAVLDTLSTLDICVIAFSRLADDLSQWRGYASSPPGFALGFHLPTIRVFAVEDGCRIEPCEYKREVQIDKFVEMIEWFRSSIMHHRAYPQERKPDGLKTLQTALLEKFAQIAPTFKDQRFAAEKEVRLITELARWRKKDRYDFHLSGSLVVPHFKFRILRDSTSALGAIRVGPGVHKKINLSNVKMLAEARGFPSVQIFGSKVPFRNWS